MRRKSRSYLNQIAEPVLPHQPVASARLRPDARRTQTRVEPPAIEDETFMPPTQPDVPPIAVSPTQNISPAESPHSPNMDETAKRPAEVPVARHDPNPLSATVVEGSKHRQVSPNTAKPATPVTVIATKQQSPQVTPNIQVPQEFSVPSPLQRGSEEQPRAAAETPRLRSKPQAHVVEAQNNIPSTEHAAAVSPEPAVARPSPNVYHPEKEQSSQRLPQPKPLVAHESSSRRETRVHIGTVEVRTTIAPQPAPVAPERAPAQPKISAPAEQLSRPLAWSFGLVQG